MTKVMKREWDVPMSRIAANSRNYLTEMVDGWRPNAEKSVISLSLSDTEVYSKLKTPKEATEALIQTVKEGKHHGYAPSVGYEFARAAVADHLLTSGVEIETKDIILCSGFAGALEMAITVFGDSSKSHNILIPRPGSPLYTTLSRSIGIEVKYYDLLPDYNWTVDLYDLESKIDSKTCAVILSNPSNPSGAIYTPAHLRKILEVCYRLRIPVIADESCEKLVYRDNEYHSVAALEVKTPILICSGIAKTLCVPGWMLGWILIHDPTGAFEFVRKGLNILTQRIIGSNTLVQGALDSMLTNTPQSFYEDLVGLLEDNAKIMYERLNSIKGIRPFMPKSGATMMVKIDVGRSKRFETTLEFVKAIYEEESVFCLPSEIFSASGFMHTTVTVEQDKLEEAIQRLDAFCNRYFK